MSCQCTEDKEVLPGGVIIGRNKVECLECQIARAGADAQKAKDDANRAADVELAALDTKKIRALTDHILGVTKVTIDCIDMTPKQYLQSLEGKAATERNKKVK